MPRSHALRGFLCLALLPACAHTATPEEHALPSVVVFEGMCDASGAIALSDRLIVVADDEDNVLRTYDVERGGPPITSTDISSALGLPLRGKKRPAAPEVDLEAGTRIGERAYWLTSHGRNASGKLRPERLRFFATTASPEGVSLVGSAYERLLGDLLAAPELEDFALGQAATLPPKEEGGLNIEGLTATPNGELLMAFRNPVPGGRALVVPIRNPAALVEGGDAVAAELGAPMLLDLGGYGVRSLSWWRGRYLIMAGHYTSGQTSRLYEWSGDGQPQQLRVDLAGFNPEGFFTPDERDEILLLSDDGEQEIDGVACKRLRDPAKKRFRGLWVRPL